MIRHSDVNLELREVRDEPAERCTIGQKDRKMIQAEQSAPRHWSRAIQLAQMNYLVIVTVSAETHGVRVAADHSHSENLLVKSERAIEIRDLQSHSAEMR
jgi:hypothetical protein